ncbi:MAG: alginate export family protein [Bythopirellula sp.]
MNVRRRIATNILGLSFLLCPVASFSQDALPVEDSGMIEEAEVELIDPEIPISENAELTNYSDYNYGDCSCAASKAAAGAYKGVFYDNDFSYLCDECYDGRLLGDCAKRLAIGNCWTVDFGGEFRLRQHNENNLRTKPLSGNSDNFLLQRTRLYLNAEYSDWFRFYGEAVDAVSYWEDFSPRSIEVNRFDGINLFADLRLWHNGCDAELWGRAGRQELLYGAQRLISPLDWSNTRRTFDGAKLMYDGPTWSVDGWWSRPVAFGQHTADGNVDHNWDTSEEDQDFSGVWASRKLASGTSVDVHFLRLADYRGVRTNANGVSGNADFNMLGARLKGKRNSWLWEAQGGVQFGDFADGDISAGFFTLGLGHVWECHCWKPTLWAYYDWASGDDDPTDTKHGTFNQYFPLAHKYFGFMDIIGRQNIEDANFLFTIQPVPKVKLLAWYHIFNLQSDTDALYNAAGNPIYQDPTGGAGGEIGQELDLVVNWSVTPRVNLLFGYSHFWAGNFFDDGTIQNSGTPAGGIASNGADGNDADFYYTQMQIRF